MTGLFLCSAGVARGQKVATWAARVHIRLIPFCPQGLFSRPNVVARQDQIRAGGQTCDQRRRHLVLLGRPGGLSLDSDGAGREGRAGRARAGPVVGARQRGLGVAQSRADAANADGSRNGDLPGTADRGVSRRALSAPADDAAGGGAARAAAHGDGPARAGLAGSGGADRVGTGGGGARRAQAAGRATVRQRAAVPDAGLVPGARVRHRRCSCHPAANRSGDMPNACSRDRRSPRAWSSRNARRQRKDSGRIPAR